MKNYCEDCDYTFSSKQMLNKHLNSKKHLDRNKEKSFKCEECGYTFSSKQMLNKHLNSKKHSDKNINFKCRYCKEIFKTNNQKTKHDILIHSDKKDIIEELLEDLEDIDIKFKKITFKYNSLYVIFKYIKTYLDNKLIKKTPSDNDNKVMVKIKGVWVQTYISIELIASLFNELVYKLSYIDDENKTRMAIFYDEVSWSKDYNNIEEKLNNFELFTKKDKDYIKSLFNIL